jgi:UDP-N-acetylglucosamine:LPS N-acetylglucosamine transferase
MIVIPIPETISRDQRSNAYAMASHGLASVLEENNLGSNILLSSISRILDSEATYNQMVQSSSYFASSRTAATVIARELIRIGLSHS